MTLENLDIKEMNRVYDLLEPLQRLEQVFKDFDNESIMVTSSFGTTSGILMGMVSKVAPGHPIHFIDTTFCFKKTLVYKRILTDTLGLNIINILPNVEENINVRETNLWESNPDECCNINKIKPFEPYKVGKKIWISGLLMNSNPFRENLEIFEERGPIIKMHPNIDTTAEGFDQFLMDNNIPPHPMIADGYESVGCTHCTTKGEGRSGRWAGKSKTECGLHTS